MCVRYVRAILAANVGPATAKLVAICIAEHANEDGEARVSQKTISEESCCAVRTVRYHLQALRETEILLSNRGRALCLNRQLVAGFECPKEAMGCRFEPSSHAKAATHYRFENRQPVAAEAEKAFAFLAPARAPACSREEEETTMEEIVPVSDEPVTYPWDDE